MIPGADYPARRQPGHAAIQRLAVRQTLDTLLADPAQRALVVEALVANHTARERLVAAIADRPTSATQCAILARFAADPAIGVARRAAWELELRQGRAL